MSFDWPEFQLGDRCMVKSSKRIFAREYVEQGVPFMRSKDVIDKAMGSFAGYDLFISDERFSEIQKTHGSPARGDLLMSSVGNRSGQPYVVQDEGDFHFKDGNILWLSEFDNINSDYLAYWLKSEMGQGALTSVMIGSAQKALTIESIRNLWVRFPSIEYQSSAANILLSLDKKIQLNRQTNQTLEHIAQALFKSWFVDFEPTRAKIAAKQAGQDPERAAMAAISGKTVAELDQLDAAQLAQLKTTAALFPDGLVESELGEVPEGWEVKSFGNCLSKTIGGDWGRDEPDQKHTKKVKILRGTDLPAVYSGSDEKVPIRFVEAKKLVTRKLFAGDIVIEVSGGSKNQPTGRSLFLTQEVIDRLGCELAPASFCRLFRPVTPEVGLILGLHLRTIYDAGKTWLYQNQSTGISNFQTKVFLEKELVAIPPEKLQKYFAKNVMPLLQKLSSCENQRLEQLRDTLLPKLLSGELSPTQAEVA